MDAAREPSGFVAAPRRGAGRSRLSWRGMDARGRPAKVMDAVKRKPWERIRLMGRPPITRPAGCRRQALPPESAPRKASVERLSRDTRYQGRGSTEGGSGGPARGEGAAEWRIGRAPGRAAALARLAFRGCRLTLGFGLRTP